MSQVTVHTKPACVQCNATTRKLRALGIPYVTAELTEESAARFRKFGHLSAPVVTPPTGSWSGYRPDLLEALTTPTDTTEGEDPE
jgi:glutaredoxin-like protein NrdH